jgi:hypothetical protein
MNGVEGNGSSSQGKDSSRVTTFCNVIYIILRIGPQGPRSAFSAFRAQSAKRAEVSGEHSALAFVRGLPRVQMELELGGECHNFYSK